MTLAIRNVRCDRCPQIEHPSRPRIIPEENNSVRHVRATCRGRDGDKHKTNEATTMRPMYQCTESLQTTWSLEDGYTVNACSPLAWTCHIGCKVPFIHRTHRNLRTQLRSSVISDRQQNKPGWGGCSGQFVLPPATIQWQKNRVKVGPGCWCIAESDAADWIPGCWPITSPCLCRWEMTARSDCRLEPWFAGASFLGAAG